MRRLIFLTLLCISPTTLAGTEDDVRCREIGFSRSVEDGDQKKFASFIDDDARFVGQSVTRGSQAIINAWGVFFTEGGPRIQWRPRIVEVLEEGNLALTRGPYRMTVTDENGNTTETWGTFNSVWRLHPDGQWRIVFDAGSPAKDAPSAEVKALLDQPDDCAQEN